MLSVNISVSYQTGKDVLRSLSFEIAQGEILGLVGASGSGKSTLALALLRLIHLRGGTVRGQILFAGLDLLSLTESRMRGVRGREIAYIPQSPATSLNPALRVSALINETWRAHRPDPISRDAMLACLREVSLPATPDFLSTRAGRLSIGQGQRLLIALALLHHPRLIIADEPTSALDLITQQEILKLLLEIRRVHGSSILFISHDLGCVKQICDRIAILHEGAIVESGETASVFHAPRHPYARRLIGASPLFSSLAGGPPSRAESELVCHDEDL